MTNEKDFGVIRVQEAIQHVPSDLIIRGSGLLGGSSALAGMAADISQWTEVSQIAANFGILLGSIVAALSLTYTIYKGFKKKPPS